MERRLRSHSESSSVRRVRTPRMVNADARQKLLVRVDLQRRVSTKMVATIICMMLAIPAMSMAISSLLVAADGVVDTNVPTPLMTCQGVQVGVVDVWNDFDNLYVKYDMTADGWYLLETHCQVATDPYLIPQKNGNPIPGQFECCMVHEPPVDEYTCTFDLSAWPAGTQLFIAAHAAVGHATGTSIEIVSDGSVMWSGDGETWENAVPCFEHDAWADVPGATWIWISDKTDVAWEYANVPDGGWEFEKGFVLPNEAFDMTGTVTANADNCEAVYVNGDFILQDGELNKDAADSHAYQSTETGDISGSLVPGQNKINIWSLNYYDSGDYLSNPAGLAFRADISYNCIDETGGAWADGYDFDGANWATYMAYTVKSWNLEGDWILRFVYGTTNYDHDMDASVVQKADGAFTATGGYPAGGPYTHTWEATGTVVRDNVGFHIDYLTGNVGYEAWVDGTIASDGSMSGTWHATGQEGPYDWLSLLGAAIWC